jgi:hypothetical protein
MHRSGMPGKLANLTSPGLSAFGVSLSSVLICIRVITGSECNECSLLRRANSYHHSFDLSSDEITR